MTFSLLEKYQIDLRFHKFTFRLKPILLLKFSQNETNLYKFYLNYILLQFNYLNNSMSSAIPPP